MAIPAQFIDELMARCDIADVVADYVPLTRKGGSLWGCCPFHSERTPSFHVVPERQMYKCFGCGKGGGVINFIMEIENLSYPDAVRFLAKRAGLEVPEERGDGGFRKRRERLLALNKEAARYFHSVLHSPAGRAGVDYLFGKRRLSKATVTRFGLGMAPDGWDKLITEMKSKGYEKSELLEAGLVVLSKEGRVYDRFRNRVMFPIIDLRGDVIGFGGRVLDDSTPKYLNSPDTPIFNKGRNLFALNIAKKTRLGRIILTEGYMDTLSLHQAGFDCAVASLGTALTGDHAQLLARYTKEVVIAYDGDGAGVSAAQRAIGLLEKTGMKVRVLRMKGAKDPDEFIGKYGAEAFAKLLDQSENHIEYRIDQVKGKYDLTDDAQRVEFLKEAVPILAQLPSPAEREIYGARCAELAGVSAEVVTQEVKRERSRLSWKAKKQQERRDLTPTVQLQPKERALRYDNIRSARAEEGVLRLVVLDPELFGSAAVLEPEHFSAPLLGKVFGLLRARWISGLSVSLAALAGELEPAEMSHLSGVLTQPESLQNGARAMRDYIEIIETEAEKRRLAGESEELLAMQKKLLEKKAYGG
ncbi:DNA primase [Intestinimonas butyriciproducens]|uniref:DNA primase n=1 Tax=Intestinimonas butyriciproducens TaxID=1297617 RepID=UPI0019576A3B|nr:DNA primase [Intestinimonas butyriciproducens]MBM6975254.1 DNA primase [Intestinimonas butyriciproducens]